MLKIKTYDKDALFLREQWATVNLPKSKEYPEGEQINISMNCDGGSILFHTPTAIYCVQLRALMNEILEQRKAGNLELKEQADDDLDDNDTKNSNSGANSPN